MAKIDYDNLTKQIVEYIGGVENIKTITHCVTRLRLYLNDRNKAEDEKIKNLPGVLGVVYGNQQYQIILGEHLFPVFDNLEKNYSVQTEAPINENLDENLVSGNEKKNFKYYFEKSNYIYVSVTDTIHYCSVWSRYAESNSLFTELLHPISSKFYSIYNA